MFRFGEENKDVIRCEIQNLTPSNTIKSKNSIWKQFTEFCKERSYDFDQENIPTEQLATILEDFGFNMRKTNSEDYKESVVKVMWNSAAKQLQEHFYKKYKRKFDPFSDIEFKNARAARNAKRRKLQKDPTKRKASSSVLSMSELKKMIETCDEESPDGLQRKFFYIASYELAWRGGEGVSACVEYFKEESDNQGNLTGRIEYNLVFSKTTQGGSKNLADSKWLITNNNDLNICPVRLFKKLMEKRSDAIKTNRLFLTVNPNWSQPNSKGWYKNCPAGINTISSWFKLGASLIGINTKKVKITNHSARATAVSALAKVGIGEQQLIKITGHSNSQSIKPYLQIDSEHHQKIVQAIRSIPTTITSEESKKQEAHSITSQPSLIYNNCVFNITTNNYNNQNNNNNKN